MSDLTSHRVALGERSYDVWIGAGAITDAVTRLVQSVRPRRVAAIIDSNLVDSHSSRLADGLRAADLDLEASALEVPPGESAKRLDVVEATCRRLVADGWERGDLILGFGGGAATDVAGFVAAILLRGVAWGSFPTSLLGMVDAAVGGKTAVNLPEGKNLVGAFWQPSIVGCDPDVLSTLPIREFRAGLAEVVKTAWLGDVALLERLEADPPTTYDHPRVADVIRCCVEVKARVVAEDEREAGRRAVLNFGHTLGHALETHGRGRWLHGEAVSLGLVAAVFLSARTKRCDEALLERMIGLLERLGLPTRVDDLDIDAVLAQTKQDKKRAGGVDRYQLTTGVGAVSVADDLPADAPRAALEFLCR